MSLSTPNNDTPSKTHNSLKSKVALYAGSAIVCYPMLLLKTRRQVSTEHYSYLDMCCSIIRYEGFRGFYKGFGIFVLGYMSAHQISNIAKRKFTNTTNSVENKNTISLSNAVGGVAPFIALHFVRNPFDVVTHRLMVQGNNNVVVEKSIFAHINNNNPEIYYKNGFDVFRKILLSDGPRGLYRGLGTTMLMSSSYYVVVQKRRKEKSNTTTNEVFGSRNGSKNVHFWMSAVIATGVTMLVTTPFDTIRTRLQVLDAVDENGRRRPLTFMRTVRNLVNEGGVLACFRGFWPRWASMFMAFAIFSFTSHKEVQSSNKSEDKLN